MRRMLAVRNKTRLGMRSDAALDRVNLSGSSILVFFALENKGGYRDAGQKFLNVPILKSGLSHTPFHPQKAQSTLSP